MKQRLPFSYPPPPEPSKARVLSFTHTSSSVLWTSSIWREKEYKAFTLAEVLITLGIIGIIAALTLPALIQNYRKKEVVTKLEKVYSIVNNAIKMAEVESGEMKTWDVDCGASAAPTCSYEDLLKKYNTYFGKYIKSVKVEKEKSPNNSLLVYMTDGSVLRITAQFYDMSFFINHKAFNNPNYGINAFHFRFNSLDKGFEPYTYSWNGTREDLFKNEYGCGNIYNAFCAKLIQYEGWQIPKDYPFKF